MKVKGQKKAEPEKVKKVNGDAELLSCHPRKRVKKRRWALIRIPHPQSLFPAVLCTDGG